VASEPGILGCLPVTLNRTLLVKTDRSGLSGLIIGHSSLVFINIKPMHYTRPL
jgi:hypothetical protein